MCNDRGSPDFTVTGLEVEAGSVDTADTVEFRLDEAGVGDARGGVFVREHWADHLFSSQSLLKCWSASEDCAGVSWTMSS